MKAAVRLLLYAIFIAAVYCEEYNVPVMLHIKRAKYLAEWRMAAFMQRRAINSYRSYQEEAEYVRG